MITIAKPVLYKKIQTRTVLPEASDSEKSKLSEN